jgi:hypothetical protein
VRPEGFDAARMIDVAFGRYNLQVVVRTSKLRPLPRIGELMIQRPRKPTDQRQFNNPQSMKSTEDESEPWNQ